MTISEAWRKLNVLLDGEPFRVTHTIMNGGTTSYPLSWCEVDYKGNVYNAETFEEVLEQIKVKYDR